MESWVQTLPETLQNLLLSLPAGPKKSDTMNGVQSTEGLEDTTGFLFVDDE